MEVNAPAEHLSLGLRTDARRLRRLHLVSDDGLKLLEPPELAPCLVA